MRINGYRCDGCGTEHLLDPNHQQLIYRGESLPDTWFIVSQGGSYTPDREPWLFCSRTCLYDHPLRHTPINTEASPAECSVPSLTIECEHDGRKYKGVIDAVEVI